MTRFLTSAIVLSSALLMGNAADAARVTFTEFTDGVTPGNTGFTMSIDPADWTDQYDTVAVVVTPLGNGSLTGSLAPTGDGEIGSGDDTAFALELVLPAPLGLGAFALGIGMGEPLESSSDVLRASFSVLGTRDISAQARDFADIVVTPGTPGFDYAVSFLEAGGMNGGLMETVSGTVNVDSIPPIPVPAGLPLLLGAMALLAPLARRSARA